MGIQRVKFFRLIISYDGTDYSGWQRQKNAQNTIVGTLESTFERAFGRACVIIGASRTDAGVHAQGQLARVQVDFDISAHELDRAWAHLLPPDIVIRDIQPVSNEWHPIRDAQQKTYQYTIYTVRPDPFVARYGWYWNRALDVSKLCAIAPIFMGTHDFRSFTTGHEAYPDTIRTIDAITIDYFNNNKILITVQGGSFLRYMIRRIVGACVLVASDQKKSIDSVRAILERRDPRTHLLTAPAQGLTLTSVI